MNLLGELQNKLWASGIWEDLNDAQLIKLDKIVTDLFRRYSDEIIGKDVDPKKPPYTQHDYGFMPANAINHLKSEQRQRRDTLLGKDKEE